MQHIQYHLTRIFTAACWGLLSLLTFASYSYAQGSILAVVSDETHIYNSFYNSLQSKLTTTNSLEIIDISGLHDKNTNEFDVVISIGSDASEILSRTSGINYLIYTLIPGRLSESINKRPCLAKKCAAVLIEQPIERYFKLFKLVFPKNKTLVIATTTPSVRYTYNLNVIANQFNISLKLIPIDKEKVIVRTLTNKLGKNDVLLALPDPEIYNKSTAKSIILSAYHKNIPIIAYSKAFAKAGALISLYSSFEDIASQTAKLATISHPVKKSGYHPETFSLELNRSVAKSLDIEISDIKVLERAIK